MPVRRGKFRCVRKPLIFALSEVRLRLLTFAIYRKTHTKASLSSCYPQRVIMRQNCDDATISAPTKSICLTESLKRLGSGPDRTWEPYSTFLIIKGRDRAWCNARLIAETMGKTPRGICTNLGRGTPLNHPLSGHRAAAPSEKVLCASFLTDENKSFARISPWFLPDTQAANQTRCLLGRVRDSGAISGIYRALRMRQNLMKKIGRWTQSRKFCTMS